MEDNTTHSTRVKAPASNLRSNPAACPSGLDESASIKPPRGLEVPDKNASRATILGPKMETSIGTWNVRTLKTDESLRILVKELSRYNCDIVGLSETHRLGTEEFFLQGYKYVGQGRTDGLHRSGVGFLLGKRAQAALLEYKPVSDRLIGITLRTVTGTATILQVYAPTTADTDAEIDLFYTALQIQISKSKPQDIVIIMGDLNAKVGSDTSAGRAAVGPFGLGVANEMVWS
jgi:hypothetical protein